MQVEVSKHTEGTKETMTRPNGLPESLIRYDGNYPVGVGLLFLISNIDKNHHIMYRLK